MIKDNSQEKNNVLNGIGSYLPASQDAKKKAEYAHDLRAQMEQNRSSRDRYRLEERQLQFRRGSDVAPSLPIALGDGIREMLGGQRLNRNGIHVNAGGIAAGQEADDLSSRKRQYGLELRAQATSFTLFALSI